jgi:hypothetical protein
MPDATDACWGFGVWGLGFGIWDFRCYSRGLRRGAESQANARFGFCPKISTPVENTVEKQAIQSRVTQKT